MNQGGTLCEKYNLHWHAWGGQDNHWKRSGNAPAWPFFDSDVRLRERIHRDIKELFRESEAAFRQEETETLRELCQKEGIVLSCGGGVIKKAENVALLKHGGFLIFLDRSLEAIASSVDQMGRPLLSASKNRLKELYDERYALYLAAADLHISVRGGIKETVEAVLAALREQGVVEG